MSALDYSRSGRPGSRRPAVGESRDTRRLHLTAVSRSVPIAVGTATACRE